MTTLGSVSSGGLGYFASVATSAAVETAAGLTLSPSTPAPEPLLCIGDVATRTGIARATLYRWRSARPGFGPRALVLGGLIRYRPHTVDAWLRAREQGRTSDSRPPTHHECDEYALMLPTELATYLAVAPRTLSGWRSGQVGPSYLAAGTLVRYRLASVENWLMEREESFDSHGVPERGVRSSRGQRAASRAGDTDREIRTRRHRK